MLGKILCVIVQFVFIVRVSNINNRIIILHRQGNFNVVPRQGLERRSHHALSDAKEVLTNLDVPIAPA